MYFFCVVRIKNIMGPKNCEAQWSSPASTGYGLTLVVTRVLWIES